MVSATTASSTNIVNSSVLSSLVLTGATGLEGAYAGNTCTNQFVRSLNGAGVASCASVSDTDFSGALGVAHGGTNISSYTPGDILYASSATTLTRVASSTSGTVLALVNGIPSWVATSTLSTISGTLSGTQLDGVFGSSGILARTTTGTYASRTITGTANQITVANGDGVSGNPTLSLPSLLSFTQSSSTRQSIVDRLYVGDTATTTILGSATSTFGAGHRWHVSQSHWLISEFDRIERFQHHRGMLCDQRNLCRGKRRKWHGHFYHSRHRPLRWSDHDKRYYLTEPREREHVDGAAAVRERVEHNRILLRTLLLRRDRNIIVLIRRHTLTYQPKRPPRRTQWRRLRNLLHRCPLRRHRPNLRYDR